MTRIIVFPDVPALVVAYLKSYLPDAMITGMDVPADWEWHDLLIVVTDVGGPGEKDVVLDVSWINLMVSHPEASTASDTARMVHGLLRHLPYSDTAVRWVKSVQRPTFTSDDESEAPAYTLTVEVTARATTQEV